MNKVSNENVNLYIVIAGKLAPVTALCTPFINPPLRVKRSFPYTMEVISFPEAVEFDKNNNDAKAPIVEENLYILLQLYDGTIIKVKTKEIIAEPVHSSNESCATEGNSASHVSDCAFSLSKLYNQMRPMKDLPQDIEVLIVTKDYTIFQGSKRIAGRDEIQPSSAILRVSGINLDFLTNSAIGWIPIEPEIFE